MPMNPSELLRKLADIIDTMSNDQNPGGMGTVINQPKANMQPVEVDATDHTDSATMVSPLQQGFEMMKMTAGTPEGEAEHEEACCEHCGQMQCECDTPMEGEDEISIMRRNAGVTANSTNDQTADAASDAAHQEPPKPNLENEAQSHEAEDDEDEEEKKTDESVYESELNKMRAIAGLKQSV